MNHRPACWLAGNIQKPHDVLKQALNLMVGNQVLKAASKFDVLFMYSLASNIAWITINPGQHWDTLSFNYIVFGQFRLYNI